ncbi:MAG: MaoC family dehydratase N-terminal domain-containing protein, partial [Proteobacteria bacterium]|nr:MaoC family dehydratase N-terminal domain-containing protein [Pseudomonadota bacterium]
MAMNYDHVMSLKSEGNRFSYTDRETMLYALGIGMGRDPLDETELAYVFERAPLKTVASMASVLGKPQIMQDSGYNRAMVVHGEMSVTLDRPLPPEGELIADARVVEAYDKGEGRGALVYVETKVRTAADDRPLFTTLSASFCRGDGGFGGLTAPTPAPH